MRAPSRVAFLIIIVALVASASHAAGVNLRWDACAGDAGVPNKNFACNTNVGAQTLVASFVLPANQSAVAGVLAKFDLSAASASLPAWWMVSTTGGCRTNGLGSNATISASAVMCSDWAQLSGAGGIVAHFTVGSLGPGTASFDIATVTQLPPDLLAGQEYFHSNIIIHDVQTVGVGACAGCSTPVCIAIQDVEVGLGPVTVLTQPANGGDSNFSTWQGGLGAPSLPGAACLAVVPTRKSAWGAVKSLYR